jgi:hypothetical protein
MKSTKAVVYKIIFLCFSFVLVRCSGDSDTSSSTPPPNNASPVVGLDGTLSIDLTSTVSTHVSWEAASDEETDEQNLEYLVYHSASNNLSSVEAIEANGSAVGSFSANVLEKTVDGLSPNTTYYINVIVRDEEGSKSAYESTSVTTTNAIYLFSEGTDRDGDVQTAEGQANARQSIDALCEARRIMSHDSLACAQTRGFLSISDVDSLVNYPTNYGLPSGVPIRSSNETLIENTWLDLLDGIILSSLSDAGVVSSFYWTGSDASGTFDDESDNQCMGFTSNIAGGGAFEANVGDSGVTNGSWLEFTPAQCGGTRPYLCVCW